MHFNHQLQYCLLQMPSSLRAGLMPLPFAFPASNTVCPLNPAYAAGAHLCPLALPPGPDQFSADLFSSKRHHLHLCLSFYSDFRSLCCHSCGRLGVNALPNRPQTMSEGSRHSLAPPWVGRLRLVSNIGLESSPVV